MHESTGELHKLRELLRDATAIAGKLLEARTGYDSQVYQRGYIAQFIPLLQVAYVLRMDDRPRDAVDLEKLAAEHGEVLLDTSVEHDGVYYRIDRAHPWVGPFPSLDAAYDAIWKAEVLRI